MPEGGETLFIRKNSNIAKRLLRSHKSKKDIKEVIDIPRFVKKSHCIFSYMASNELDNYNGQKKKDKRTMRDFAKGIVIVEVLCGFYYITYFLKTDTIPRSSVEIL